MLRSPLQHPDILTALAGAGHGALVLVADANYPASTTVPAGVTRVHLNLVPGTVDGPAVVQALLTAVAVEEALVMQPNATGPYALPGDPPVWDAYRAALADAGSSVPLQPLERFAFYEAAGHRDVALAVVTGETAWYANVLLRIAALSQRATGGERGGGRDVADR